MRREATVLVVAMFIATLMSAACDRQEQRNMAPTAPDLSRTAPNPDAASSVPKVAQAPMTAAEQKDAAMPTQGEVDPKDPAQRRDFEQKK